MNCPVCSSKIILLKKVDRCDVPAIKFDDEKVYWCRKCRKIFYEEDLMFNIEEF